MDDICKLFFPLFFREAVNNDVINPPLESIQTVGTQKTGINFEVKSLPLLIILRLGGSAPLLLSLGETQKSRVFTVF